MWPAPAAPQLGVFVERQVRALRALGATVDVVTIPPAAGGVRAPLKWVRLIRRARRAARVAAPDVVLGHFLFPAGEAARQAARAVGVPYVVTCHGQDVTNAERSKLLARLTERVLADAWALVAVSGDLRDRLFSVVKALNNVELVNMGVDVHVFRPGDRDVCRHAVNAPTGGPLIVQVGAKNLAVLADAVAILRARRPGATLWVVGGADAGPGPGGCRLLGRLTPEAVARYLRAADGAAFVSLREGYGLGALEAAACGTPVVVSRGLPVAADLAPGATVLVDPSDATAVAMALDVALGLERDQPDALAAVQQQSVEVMARRTLALLERCIAEHTARPLP